MENYLDMDTSQIPEETKKRVDKERRKGEKKMEQFMKSIQELSPDEKIGALCKKNTEFLEDIRGYKGSVLMLQRKVKLIQREKELLENEHSKGVLARSRLETLCRELQRQNKSIKDESLQKIREEEEKRKEVSSRFQTSLNEVSQMMQQNTDKNLKLREDNIEISNKFQKLCDQFRQREEEVTKLTKQMNLEKQLAEATRKRIECQLNAEREIWNKEKAQHAEQLKYGVEERAKLEVNLRTLEEHLSMYSKKYEEFESTIVKSNQVFDSYKTEMSRMTKQINRLEKDCNVWKDRWQQTQSTLNKVICDNQTMEKNLAGREKKLNKLADLCRLIQEERTVYLKQLKDNSITPSNTAKLSVPSTSVGDEVKLQKEDELLQLKNEMSALKVQLSETQECCEKKSVSTYDNHGDTKSEVSKSEIVDEISVSEEISPADENVSCSKSDGQNSAPVINAWDIRLNTNVDHAMEQIYTSIVVSNTTQVTNVEENSNVENDLNTKEKLNISIYSTSAKNDEKDKLKNDNVCNSKTRPKARSSRPKKNRK